MSAWLIRPRDTLVLSDGRPFQTGLSAPSTLDLPWASSLMGMFCTALGRDDEGHFALNKEEARSLHNELSVRGPLLVAHSAHADSPEGAQDELLVPVPKDALWLRHPTKDEVFSRHRLVPERLIDAESDRGRHLLSAQHDVEGEVGQPPELLYPFVELPKGKLSEPFKYWRWSSLERWLASPSSHDERALSAWRKEYVAPLPKEHRTHVTLSSSLAPEGDERLRAALEGHLFGVWGQRYQEQDASGALRDYSLWATLAHTQGEALPKSPQGWAQLGGERRLVELSPSAQPTPSLTPELKAALKGQRLVKVILLTPALFEAGSSPKALLEGGHKLVAQSVGRPQSVSGWDVAKQRPKAMRRMAPAGSVYWVELAEGTDAVAWAEGRFMTNVSDDPNDSRQGFGLCVVGVA